MILSQARNYVFVHIPKTAGTSLALALEERAAKDDILIGDTPKAKKRRQRLQGVSTRGRLWKHSTLADIDGLVSQKVLAELFAFTIVRNPWDRVVSYYHWLLDQTFDHPAVQLAHTLDFGSFVTHPMIGSSLRSGTAASYMRRADGVEQCQLYIRLENFAQDAQPLFDHLGFDLSLPRANTSERGDFRSYFDPATRQAVAQTCADDIARFGYEFDD
jgi:sulfotransferase famil protein